MMPQDSGITALERMTTIAIAVVIATFVMPPIDTPNMYPYYWHQLF
jgi:hypothetical protein